MATSGFGGKGGKAPQEHRKFWARQGHHATGTSSTEARDPPPMASELARTAASRIPTFLDRLLGRNDRE